MMSTPNRVLKFDVAGSGDSGLMHHSSGFGEQFHQANQDQPESEFVDRLLVKCDVEGHETEIFADCPSLWDRRLGFVVDLHNVHSPDDSIVVARARAAGRSVSALGQFRGGTVTVAF